MAGLNDFENITGGINGDNNFVRKIFDIEEGDYSRQSRACEGNARDNDPCNRVIPPGHIALLGDFVELG